MSSLLDILHRKDSRADNDEAPEPAEVTAQTVELHLAVDNGPAEPGMDRAAGPPDPPAYTSPAPLPEGDATRVLMARQLQRRSHRSTVLLGAGLAVIVIGAGLSTWLLDETTGLAGGHNSQFNAPADAEVIAPGTVERPVVESPPPATPLRAADPIETDTAWYDTPAVEEPVGEPGESTAEPIRIVRGTTTNPVFPKLSEAFAAFQAADFARAEALYREVRAADPGNVDALLGLGALAARGSRTEEAREFYQAVLLAEPRNAAAISAMSTLPAAGARNLDESTLKSLLRDQPGAANLHFALGLQYVAQGRWPDAQMAFFDAVRNEPANADYAYNLAVSLDQLGQSAPAAAYYQRALELASASSLFNAGAAGERLATLRSAGP